MRESGHNPGKGRKCKMKRKECEGCIYYRRIDPSDNTSMGCHYLYDTYDLRAQPPGENCTKYLHKNEVAKKFTIPPDEKAREWLRRKNAESFIKF